MNTREALEIVYVMNGLNEKGLRMFIKHLRNEVHDYSERIKDITTKKGLHNLGK